MQKLINVLALASFAVSASIVGAGAYAYLNKDALIEKAKERATEAIQEAVGNAIGGQLAGDFLGGETDESSPVPMPSMPF